MTRAMQEGKGRDRIVTEGEKVTTKDGFQGTIISFGGRSHQHCVLKDDAGYTHTVDTQDVL